MKTHDSLPAVKYNEGPGEWAARAEEAFQTPDKWIEVGEFHRSMVTYLRSGRCHGIDPERIEVASRKVEGNISTIFIKARP